MRHYVVLCRSVYIDAHLLHNTMSTAFTLPGQTALFRNHTRQEAAQVAALVRSIAVGTLALADAPNRMPDTDEGQQIRQCFSDLDEQYRALVRTAGVPITARLSDQERHGVLTAIINLQTAVHQYVFSHTRAKAVHAH